MSAQLGPFINYVTQKGRGGGGISQCDDVMYTLSIHQYGKMCDEGGEGSIMVKNSVT